MIQRLYGQGLEPDSYLGPKALPWMRSETLGKPLLYLCSYRMNITLLKNGRED